MEASRGPTSWTIFEDLKLLKLFPPQFLPNTTFTYLPTGIRLRRMRTILTRRGKAEPCREEPTDLKDTGFSLHADARQAVLTAQSLEHQLWSSSAEPEPERQDPLQPLRHPLPTAQGWSVPAQAQQGMMLRRWPSPTSSVPFSMSSQRTGCFVASNALPPGRNSLLRGHPGHSPLVLRQIGVSSPYDALNIRLNALSTFSR